MYSKNKNHKILSREKFYWTCQPKCRFHQRNVKKGRRGKEGTSEVAAQTPCRCRCSLPDAARTSSCLTSKREADMRGREAKTLKLCVPIWDVDSPKGRPLKKVPETQAPTAAPYPVRHLNREPSQGRPQGKPNQPPGSPAHLRISFFTSRSSSSWSF